MRLLFLTFYFPPDLSAGSFRSHALVQQLTKQLPRSSTIDVLTTVPNRYRSFERNPPELEQDGIATIRRIPVTRHQSGLVDQSRTFLSFAKGVWRSTSGAEYDLVFATSSRLMTAALGASLSKAKSAPLYLDIRDIFVDTVKDVFKGPTAATMLPGLAFVEGRTVRSAKRVNLVSRGFEHYFASRYPAIPFDFFTNGIDDEFLAEDWTGPGSSGKRARVLYAGNVGQGQGLHAILPALAARTARTHEYVIVGDGGARRQLEEKLAPSGLENVKLVSPVGRDELMHMYREADILFLHLNDLPAFEKVLPSKVFEYAATGKPLLAGVGGFARRFIMDEISNSGVFRPCDVDDAVSTIRKLELRQTDRREFVETYRRDEIMRRMASSVLATAGTRASSG